MDTIKALNNNESQGKEVIQAFSVLLIVSWKKTHLSVIISITVAKLFHFYRVSFHSCPFYGQ